MTVRYLTALAVVLVAGGGASAPGGGFDATPDGRTTPAPIATSVPALICKLPPRTKKLPARARHGLVQHLQQYPTVRLATRRQRARARFVLAQLVSASRQGRWRDLRAVALAGYDTRTAPRKAGDRTIHYFHAERDQEPRSVIVNPRRPKALIYANAPGRPLALVGAMWSTRRGEMRPHSGRADHALALARHLLRRAAPRPEAAGQRHLSAGHEPPARSQRDAACLVHRRPPKRVRHSRT